MNNKIDFVITWVDGNDPEWQSEKQKFSPDIVGDNRSIRYRDWDILYYWFRAVEVFTPWVNRIHLITYGHLPGWLNAAHPKLNIVKHSEFIPKQYLPTFNSHTIEWNLHLIDGLEEKFVYFNDDMYLIRPMEEAAFFKSGLPCDTLEESPYLCNFRNSIGSIIANNMEIINANFNKGKSKKNNFYKWFHPLYGKSNLRTLACQNWNSFVGFAGSHFPNNYLKSTFYEIWDKEFDILDHTCRHRFRDKRDVNHWLVRYWQLVSGTFMPKKNEKKKYFTLSNDYEPLYNAIIKQKYSLICINDKDIEMNYNLIQKKLHQAFMELLPNKSQFEK